MAIRDVVTRGYGNGTYDPGVARVPARGYTSTIVTTIMPMRVQEMQAFLAGSVTSQVFLSGPDAMQTKEES